MSAAIAACCLLAAGNAQAEGPLVELHAASTLPEASTSLLLGIARAGGRIVAVGEGGTVALSDDHGATFRRARSVPVQGALTAVCFADDHHGWAVGHWGVVLHTDDAGETWTVQRADTAKDQPLFGIACIDARRAVAVGLWSLILRTADGGANWQTAEAPPPAPGKASASDRNLFHPFLAPSGTLYVTAEGGTVLRSGDGGESWQALATGYAGSLWAGLALDDSTLLVGGLRGTLLRSADRGATWTHVTLDTRSSITALAADGAGGFVAVGLDGLLARGTASGNAQASVVEGAPALSALVVDDDGALVLASQRGALRPPRATARALEAGPGR